MFDQGINTVGVSNKSKFNEGYSRVFRYSCVQLKEVNIKIDCHWGRILEVEDLLIKCISSI